MWRTRLLLGSAVAVAAVMAAAMTVALIRPANAWAQVAKAVQDRPWVHTRTLGPDGKEYGESWFSVKNNVSAVRHGPIVEYHDKTLKVVAKYVADEGVVYRIPENPELAQSTGVIFSSSCSTPSARPSRRCPAWRSSREIGVTWLKTAAHGLRSN